MKGFTPWKARYLEVTPTTSSFVDGLSIRIVLTFLFSWQVPSAVGYSTATGLAKIYSIVANNGKLRTSDGSFITVIHHPEVIFIPSPSIIAFIFLPPPPSYSKYSNIWLRNRSSAQLQRRWPKERTWFCLKTRVFHGVASNWSPKYHPRCFMEAWEVRKDKTLCPRESTLHLDYRQHRMGRPWEQLIIQLHSERAGYEWRWLRWKVTPPANCVVFCHRVPPRKQARASHCQTLTFLKRVNMHVFFLLENTYATQEKCQLCRRIYADYSSMVV